MSRTQYYFLKCLVVLIAGSSLAGRHCCAGEVRCVAMAGEPFGIGEISFPVDAGNEIAWLSRGIRLTEQADRVVLPVMKHPGFFPRIASKMKGEFPQAPHRDTIYFFFIGDQELQLRLSHLPDKMLTVIPEPLRQAKYDRMTRKWWKQIWGPLVDRMQDSNRPRPVENYLAGLGIWRLGINRHPACPKTTLGRLQDLLLGTSRMRANMSRSVSFDRCCVDQAELPLPPPMLWRTAPIAFRGEVAIEDIAHRVPEECFYVRFGKYSNMLWATRVLESQGEELQRLVTLRGFQGHANQKLERQLAISELPFADLIGDQLIKDVALIGRDFFVTDGAAFGIILHSDSSAFATGLEKVRKDALRRWKKHGAASQQVTIAGREVSFISTPDNQLRSFHAVDGEWHLISNSEQIMDRCLRVPQEENSLADLPAFRRMRAEMPLDREDSVFAYVSTRFMERITTPRYLIELQRRLRARAELQMLEVAVRVARLEDRALIAAGRPVRPLDESGDVVSQLKDRELLPAGFACRSDGSTPVWASDHALDSLRGAMGTFIPIADLGVSAATAEESRVYRQFAANHRGAWNALDPVAIGIQRQSHAKDSPQEKLSIDARVAPLQSCNAALLSGLLGQPRPDRLAASEDALMVGEAVISGRLTPNGRDARLQLTVEDGQPITGEYRNRLSDLVAIVKQLELRLLVEPSEAALDRVWWHPAGTEEDPYFYGPLDAIGRAMDDHAAIAFDQRLLEDIPATLVKQDREERAQAFFRIRDLRGSAVERVITSLTGERAMRGSMRNIQLFHQWSNLLATNVPEAPALVELLVGMEAVCPLGGEYTLGSTEEDEDLWTTSAFGADSLQSIDLAEYQPALLRWCHGLAADVNVSRDELRLNAEVDVEFHLGEPSTSSGLNSGLEALGKNLGNLFSGKKGKQPSGDPPQVTPSEKPGERP